MRKLFLSRTARGGPGKCNILEITARGISRIFSGLLRYSTVEKYSVEIRADINNCRPG